MLPSPAPNTCVMLLVRHGATDNNVAQPPLLQGRSMDPPLSVDGQRQADQTAQLLAGISLTAAYSSPLVRAQQTAERIVTQHGLDVQTVEPISEVDVGSWEGRSWDEIEKTEPERYRQFMSDPATHGYQDGENLNEVHARVVPCLTELLTKHLGGTILVVGHNVVNRVFLAHLLDLPTSHARRICQDNCGVNAISCRENVLKLRTLNTVLHLT